MEDHSVVNQRKTDGHVEIGVTAMCAAGLRRVADRKADAIAIGFQRREQGLQLDDRGPAFRTVAVVGEGAAKREFEVAARIAGR